MDQNKPKSLFDLAAEMARLQAKLIEGGGELPEELEEDLKTLDMNIGAKIDRYRFFIMKLEADAEFWKAEAQARAKIAAQLSSLGEQLKTAIKSAMIRLEMKEITGPTFRAVLSPTKPSLKIDEKLLPKEFTSEVIVIEPNKEKIKDALDRLEPVPGARLEGGHALRFFANKGG